MYGLTEMLNSAASTRPGAISTRCNGRVRTWRETRDRVARLAHAMTALGVGRGDRVAILALNSDRYTEFLSAAWWAGAVAVPMNIRWSAAENAYSLMDSQTGLLFVDAAFAGLMPETLAAAPCVKNLVFCDDGPPPAGMFSHDDLIATTSPAIDAEAGGEDIAGLYYTGGTTGFPKGVAIPHRALWYNNMLCAKLLALEADDIVLHTAPMFHMADSCSGGGASITGASHAYIPRFDPELAMAAIERDGVTHTVMVPVMLGMILRHANFRPERLRSLRGMAYGGSVIARGVLAEAIAKLPHVDFLQVYGQTEMAPVITSLPPRHHVLEGEASKRLASAGRVVPGTQIRIVDENADDVTPGTVGEIICRGPGMMLGYWNKPDQTAAAIRNGWVHTGDGAWADDDGFIYIVDRLKDMIVTGGENVFTAEVESAISTHPAIAEVAVIGIPSEKWGEEVHAVIVLRVGHTTTQAAIIAHCAPLIANYKCPRSISIRAESLPLSGAGKVLKRDLRAPFWQGRDTNVA